MVKTSKGMKKEKKFDFVPYRTWRLLESLPIEVKSPKPEKKVRIEELRMKSTLKNPYSGQSAKAWSESFEFTIKLLKVNSR